MVAYRKFDCIRLLFYFSLKSQLLQGTREGRRGARPKPNSILIPLFIYRYEVLYHESCAVGCPTGLPESGTNVGLLRRHVVRDLSPYTMYNFRIRVYNTLYSSLSDEQAVRTQASGMVIAQLLIWVSKLNRSNCLNHGQKSFGKFAFVGFCSSHTCSSPPPLYKQSCFPECQHGVGWGEGELHDIFRKGWTVWWEHPQI